MRVLNISMKALEDTHNTIWEWGNTCEVICKYMNNVFVLPALHAGEKNDYLLKGILPAA